MLLDVSPLESALGQLEKSLGYYHSPLAEQDSGLKEQFRAAVIQAFEFSFELTIKMIRRRLAQIVTNPAELPELSFMEMIRRAYEAGLVREAPAFRRFRESRNVTSHTYDGGIADTVLAVAEPFLAEARFVLEQLRERNAGDGHDA